MRGRQSSRQPPPHCRPSRIFFFVFGVRMEVGSVLFLCSVRARTQRPRYNIFLPTDKNGLP